MTATFTTVALYGCPARNSAGHPVTLSGLFAVEEHWGVEPSAYVWSPYWVVSRLDADPDDESEVYDVDDDVFLAQTDPKGYGRLLVQEREMVEYAEGEER